MKFIEVIKEVTIVIIKIIYILYLAACIDEFKYYSPSSNFGVIPFNRNVNYDLPEDVKIACKTRFISCTLGFSLYGLPFVYALVGLLTFSLKMLLGVTKRIITYN